jgi:hypothetical protein
MAHTHQGINMKSTDIKQPKPKKVEGKKLDPVAVLKKAYKDPGYAKDVGGRGYV